MTEQDKSAEDFYTAQDDPARILRPRNPFKTAAWVLVIAALWAGIVFACFKFPAQFKDSALGASRIVLLRKAAMGDARSEGAMGDFYFAGIGGVKKDYAQALSWHRKAAEQGFAHSEAMLGAIYENGDGVPADDAAALDWFRKAAVQGNSFGEFGLAKMYYDGKGTPQNLLEAFKWMQLSADHGFSHAQTFLGTMYRDGQAVAPDNVQAYKWYTLAESGGKRYREALAPKMTPEQIAEAKRLAGAWEKTPVDFSATP